MSQDVGDYYLRHDEVALRLGKMDYRDVVKAIEGGEFGDGVIKIGRYFYVPQAGFNAFCRPRRIFDDSGQLKRIYARSPKELTSKVQQLKRNHS